MPLAGDPRRAVKGGTFPESSFNLLVSLTSIEIFHDVGHWRPSASGETLSWKFVKQGVRCKPVQVVRAVAGQWEKNAVHTLTHKTGRQADKAVPQNLRASVHSSGRAVSQPWRAAVPERITSPEVCALNRQRCGTGDLAAQWQGYPGIYSFSVEAFVFVAALSANEDNTGWRRHKKKKDKKRAVGLSFSVCAATV